MLLEVHISNITVGEAHVLINIKFLTSIARRDTFNNAEISPNLRTFPLGIFYFI
jgi:hypothetical protein